MGDLAFAGLVIITLVSAFWVVVSKNLVRSAIALLFTLFGLAGFYIFLFADFIAAAQVIIYVGGILVLIIFGVMVTNKIDDPNVGSSSRNQLFASIGSFFILSILLTVIMRTEWKTGELTSRDNTIKDIGHLLMKDFVLPFEIVSVLLLAALIGAAYLSRKDA